MKRIIFVLLSLIAISSCGSKKTLATPLELNFPLRQSAIWPFDEEVRRLAVSDTWFAVQLFGKIVAVDIDTRNVLWYRNFAADIYSEFQILNDVLVVASENQIITIDRGGNEKEIRLEATADEINIVKLVSVTENYLYVIRGSKWTLEAYDIPKSILLWRTIVGRGGGDDVFYEPQSDIAYISGGPIQAIDNRSGSLLWKQDGNVLNSIYLGGVLYVYEQIDSEGNSRFAAFDVGSLKWIWNKHIALDPSASVNRLGIIDDLLVASAGNLIALDKISGEKIWSVDVGESFYASPVKYADTLYARAGDNLYAISPVDGKVLGFVRLENSNLFTAETFGDIYTIEDGILFSNSNFVFMYKPK
ncbi:MAG: Outer membrane protein assembly factor BamB [Anaerolineales bacterium]|nr:Outer membrane protein assembly factor BamB [Anaerolineales bacterium]